jgi:predicted phosphoribosyltransferase
MQGSSTPSEPQPAEHEPTREAAPAEPPAADGTAEPVLPYLDRASAGRILAGRVARSGIVAGPAPPVILAIPRGGVPVGAALAEVLNAPLDVLVAHKVGAPGQPELAVGAVASDGTALMEPWAREAGIADDRAFNAAAAEELAVARRREAALRAGRPPIPLRGRTAVLVDDGMATGATMHVACLAARARGAARVVVAVPVASAEAVASIRRIADDVVAAATPDWFRAVGEWYVRFEQLDDAEVERILASSSRVGEG